MQTFFRKLHFSICVIAVAAMSLTNVNAQPTKGGKPKKLATGVLQVIPTEMDERDSYTIPISLPGLTAAEFQPNYLPQRDTLYGQSKNVVLFRDVWAYEFSFLPLRMARVKGKTVWYMIYRIRNQGKTLSYDQVKDKFNHINYDLKKDESEKVSVTQFLPRFSLEGWASTPQGEMRRAVYRDQVNPRACSTHSEPRRSESSFAQHLRDVDRQDSQVIRSDQPWCLGVAIWEDIDPTLDYVSVFVSGLTNAYRISETNEGIGFAYRTLQLNFWRPGDTAIEIQDDIDYGIPLVDDSVEQVEICRRYQIPGPVVRAYRVDPNANQNVLVMETSAEVSLDTFRSQLVPELGAGTGKLPAALSKAFAESGITVPDGAPTTNLVKASKWTLKDAEGNDYVLKIEPLFWEPNIRYDGIRFLKRLDYFWVYR